MATVPTLGEILSIGRDTNVPGGLAPNVPFDNRGLISQLNENARFQAENTWKKYNAFQEQLGNLFKNIQDISGLEVMDADKEKLDMDRKDVLDSIYNSPKEFFGSGNMKRRMELEGKLAKYRTDATASKNNNLIHQAHQKLLEATPELNTEENRNIIDQYSQQPLGARKLPSLVMPTVFDANAVLKGIFGPQGVSTRTSPYLERKDGMLIEGSQTVNDYDLAMNSWMGALYSPDKYGHSHFGWAESQFNALNPDQKKYYQGIAGDDKQKQIEAFWRDYGEQQMPFRTNAIGNWNQLSPEEKNKYNNNFENYWDKNKDIIRKDTQKITEDYETKFNQALQKMAVKFSYDKILKAMTEGARETFALFQQDHGMGKASGGKALNDTVVSLIKSAQAAGKKYEPTGAGAIIGGAGAIIAGAGGGGKNEYVVNWSPQHIKLFETDKTVGTKTVKTMPKTVTVDDDGNVHLYFLDASLDRTISPDDFKALMADKYHLTGSLEASNENLLENYGVPSLNGNVNQYWQDRTSGNVEKKPTEPKKTKATKKTADPLGILQ